MEGPDPGYVFQTERLKTKLDTHFDFLRLMADYRKIKLGKGLSQHDFKVLSYLYFYILDNYGSVNLKDPHKFYEKFAAANGKLLNKTGEYKDIPHTKHHAKRTLKIPFPRISSSSID